MAQYLDKVNYFQNQVSQGVSDMLEPVGEAVIDGVCFLRNKYPRTFSAGGVLNPIMDRLCVDNGKLPSPVIPPPLYSGGQCDFRYDLAINVQVFPSTTSCASSPQDVSFFVSTVWGPVVDVYLDVPDGVCGGFQRLFVLAHGRNGEPRSATPVPIAISLNSYGRLKEILSVNVSPFLSSDVDNCGDKDSERPPDPTIDPSDFTRTVTICGTPADPEDQRCIDVEINFDDSLDPESNQCYTIDGYRYCFTPDGVEREPAPETPPDFPPNLDDFDSEDLIDVEEVEEEDPEIEYLLTQITTFPVRYQQVNHAGGGNTDYYAGYLTWTTSAVGGSYRHPAIAIRKERQIFRRPDYATGYVIYTTFETKLKVTKYKKPES